MRRRLPRPAHPDRQAAVYLARVFPMLREMREVTVHELHQAARVSALVLDSADAPGRGLRAVEAARAELGRRWSNTRLGLALRPVGTEVTRLAGGNVARALGIPVAEALGTDVAATGKTRKTAQDLVWRPAKIQEFEATHTYAKKGEAFRVRQSVERSSTGESYGRPPVDKGFATRAEAERYLATRPPAGTPAPTKPPVAASTDRVGEWAAENARLIKTVPGRYFDQVAELVARDFRAGARWEDLSKKLEERYGVSRTNADRIARTETSKLNAEVTKERFTRLGVRRAVWRTSQDERVRDTHEDLEGQEYSLTEGIGGIYPGSEPNCRCWAEPVIEI